MLKKKKFFCFRFFYYIRHPSYPFFFFSLNKHWIHVSISFFFFASSHSYADVTVWFSGHFSSTNSFWFKRIYFLVFSFCFSLNEFSERWKLELFYIEFLLFLWFCAFQLFNRPLTQSYLTNNSKVCKLDKQIKYINFTDRWCLKPIHLLFRFLYNLLKLKCISFIQREKLFFF